MLFFILNTIFTLLFFLWMLFTLLSIIKGAPFIRTKKQTVTDILELAHIQPNQKTVDIGSGDGTILLAFAKAGAQAHGYEINILLVIWTWLRIRYNHLQSKAFIHWSNMWTTNFSDYDIITLYGIVQIMPDMEKKLQKELKPGAKVITNTFTFPNWNEITTKEKAHLYIKK